MLLNQTRVQMQLLLFRCKQLRYKPCTDIYHNNYEEIPMRDTCLPLHHYYPEILTTIGDTAVGIALVSVILGDKISIL